MNLYKQSGDKYPELYIPNTIVSIGNTSVPIPSAPLAPSKPQKPTKPVMPDNSSDIKTFGCFSVAIIVAGIVVFSNLNILSGSDLFTMLLYLFVMGIICIPLFFGLMKGNSKEKSEYPQKIRKYEDELRRYPTLEKEYEKQWQEYQQKLSRYNDKVTQLSSPVNTRIYRVNLLNEFFKTTKPLYFQHIDETDKVKKGASESFFLQFLHQIDDVEIFTNNKVQAGSSYYYPDFILHDKKSGLLCDIEIDEPYNGFNGEAIHYVEILYSIKKSIDEKRNEFFTKNNWIVIRFAEQQIFNATQSCVNFIVEVINKIGSVELNSIQIDDNLIIDKWTKEQSHLWAYKRYRHSYVPQRYHSFIVVEDYESDKGQQYTRKKDEIEKELLLKTIHFSRILTVEQFKKEMKTHSIQLKGCPNPQKCGYILNDNGITIGFISPEICSEDDIKRPVIGITQDEIAVLFNTRELTAADLLTI